MDLGKGVAERAREMGIRLPVWSVGSASTNHEIDPAVREVAERIGAIAFGTPEEASAARQAIAEKQPAPLPSRWHPFERRRVRIARENPIEINIDI